MANKIVTRLNTDFPPGPNTRWWWLLAAVAGGYWNVSCYSELTEPVRRLEQAEKRRRAETALSAFIADATFEERSVLPVYRDGVQDNDDTYLPEDLVKRSDRAAQQGDHAPR